MRLSPCALATAHITPWTRAEERLALAAWCPKREVTARHRPHVVLRVDSMIELVCVSRRISCVMDGCFSLLAVM